MNALLLVKAHRFYRDRSNSNAKDVFRASLWYLPAALTLFVYHSKRWGLTQEESARLIAESPFYAKLAFVKQHLKAACVHEFMTSEEGSARCPVVVAEVAADKAVTQTAGEMMLVSFICAVHHGKSALHMQLFHDGLVQFGCICCAPGVYCE